MFSLPYTLKPGCEPARKKQN